MRAFKGAVGVFGHNNEAAIPGGQIMFRENCRMGAEGASKANPWMSGID